MKLPRGRLRRRRIVADVGTVLANALDARHTGYATLTAQNALLQSVGGAGVVIFEDGIPIVAFHTGTDRGGPLALADIAGGCPYRLELFELDASILSTFDEATALRVPPGMPADRLAGDPALAARTRSSASAAHRRLAPDPGTADQPGAVEAFLADQEKIEAIRDRARREAERRAENWGFR